VGAHDLRPLWSPSVSLNLVSVLTFNCQAYRIWDTEEECELWCSTNQWAWTCKQVLGKYKNVSKICNITWELFFQWCATTLARQLPIMNLATPIGILWKVHPYVTLLNTNLNPKNGFVIETLSWTYHTVVIGFIFQPIIDICNSSYK